jgi:hypothetical protein
MQGLRARLVSHEHSELSIILQHSTYNVFQQILDYVRRVFAFRHKIFCSARYPGAGRDVTYLDQNCSSYEP